MSQDLSNSIEIKINGDIIKDRKLFIATPMYGGNCTVSYLFSLIQLVNLAKEYSITLRIESIWNDALVTRARNDLVDKFLKSDYEYFMFIDSDISFNAYDILYMLQLMVEEKNKEILVATYPKKTINWEQINSAVKNNCILDEFDYEKYSGTYVLNFDKNKKLFKFDLLKPLEILDAGTGFMMIKRNVFKKFKKAYPEQTYADHDTREKRVAYFDCKIDPDDGIYLSEDYMFTRWANKIGIKTWLLPWVHLSHQGTYNFNGSYAAEASLFYKTKIEKKKNDSISKLV
jgi:hypothetical protein